MRLLWAIIVLKNLANQEIKMTKLTKIIEITATLDVLTGLSIGGGDSEMHIGGVDAPIIKDPFTNLPYIPGSSLKGKIRSLLELASGKCYKGNPLTMTRTEKKQDGKDEVILVAQGDPFSENIVKLFGESADIKSKTPILGRLSFWDAKIQNAEEIKKATGGYLTEVKTENVINRIKGTAEHPRQMERIPAGAKFEFKLTMKQFSGDDNDELLDTLKKGLKLLEMDSLGGSGSRGYGKVKFVDLKFGEESVDLSTINPFPEE